jgi:hypothetical protein
MSTTLTLDALITSRPTPHTLDGDRGILFWILTSRDAWPEPVQVFVSARQAAEVDQIDLGVGAELRIAGALLANGIVSATTLSQPPVPSPIGRLLGTVEVPIPPLARLDPRRKRRYRLGLWGSLGVVMALGIAGMVTDNNVVGGVAFMFFLATCVWLVINDLGGRRVDRREYHALASTAIQRIQAHLDIVVPEAYMLALLGAGLERTGDPWAPTRPNSPRAVIWGGSHTHPPYRAYITPTPLQPGTTATIIVTLLGGEADHRPLPH